MEVSFMRAWEIEKLSSQCQIPVQLEDNNEEIWLEQGTAQEESLHAAAKIYWGAVSPAPCSATPWAVAAIQATENRGRIVERSDELLLAGFRAITENDIVELHRATHQLFEGCRNAVIDESVDYWQYRLYDTFDQYVAAVRLPGAAGGRYGRGAGGPAPRRLAGPDHRRRLRRLHGGLYHR